MDLCGHSSLELVILCDWHRCSQVETAELMKINAALCSWRKPALCYITVAVTCSRAVTSHSSSYTTVVSLHGVMVFMCSQVFSEYIYIF